MVSVPVCQVSLGYAATLVLLSITGIQVGRAVYSASVILSGQLGGTAIPQDTARVRQMLADKNATDVWLVTMVSLLWEGKA